MNKDKIGRNDLCWCNSGGKYKKCHLQQDQVMGVIRDLYLDGEGRDGMRVAGAFNAELMDYLRPMIVPGAALTTIDDAAYEYTTEHGHRPAPLGYRGFPKSICTSVNEVVCHGIPDAYVLKNGDIVNVDLTSIVNGWHGDQSETFLIGDVDPEAKRLVQCAFDSMHLAIDALSPRSKVIEIGGAIQPFAEEQGFSVVRMFQGHGIGKTFHQLPGVPHYQDERRGQFILDAGLCFTIEPMINAGNYHCAVSKEDGWTAKTLDGGLSAQFEHTILMTEQGSEILTLTEDGPQKGHKF